jgi:hypothetical protein
MVMRKGDMMRNVNERNPKNTKTLIAEAHPIGHKTEGRR